jgi:hypothetical protein
MTDREEIINYIINDILITDYHIGKLLAKITNNRYCVITDNNKDKWFKYNGEYWATTNSIIHELKNILSSEVAQYILDARQQLRKEIYDGNEMNIEWNKSRIHHLLAIERKLYNATAKNNIIKECESILYKERLPEIKRGT